MTSILVAFPLEAWPHLQASDEGEGAGVRRVVRHG